MTAGLDTKPLKATGEVSVLQVVTQLERAGAQSLAHWLQGVGHPDVAWDTRFLYLKSPSDLFDVDAALVPTRPQTVSELCVLLRRAWNLRDYDVVIAHTHYAIALFTAIRLLRRHGAGHLVAVHHWPESRYPKPVRALLTVGRLTRTYDAEICVSPAIAEHSGQQVIVNPITTRAGDATSDPHVDLLLVGRHSAEKRIDTAIRGLVHLPGRHLTLAGTGVLTNELLDLARSVGVDDRVRFLGSVGQEEIAALMNGCACLLLTSEWEALPMAILEGVGRGCDVVVSDIPQHATLIASGAVLPFTFGDDMSLSEAVASLDDLAARSALRHGRSRLLLDHDPSTLSATWLQLLKRTTQRGLA